jgi:signal transduction histidine kinase
MEPGRPRRYACAVKLPAAPYEDPMPLDQPLPVELTGRFDSWWTRYRRHPVFSRRWAAGRAKVWGLVVTAVLLCITATMALSEQPLERLWVVLTKLVLLLLLPILAGPWIGHVIHRRHLPARIEVIALLAALGLLAALAMLSSRYLAAPITDTVMRLAGQPLSASAQATARISVGVWIGPQGKASTEAKGMIRCPDGEQRNADGACEAQDLDDLQTSPAQWMTTGLSIFLLSGGLAIFGIRKERDALAALARERALAHAQARRREAELQLSVLAAQVEPHFLFNTLAGVRSAIHGDPARASAMIDRLVDYLRASIPKLRADGEALATLGQQLDVVRAYLGLMATRLARLTVTVDVDEALLAHRFPPLMLISLAENAIKHGVEPKLGPAHVDVGARLTDDGRLAVTVADDGVGFGTADTAGSGIGLANIRERLRQMHGAEASLDLRARPGGGVAATLTVPVDTPPTGFSAAPAPAAAAESAANPSTVGFTTSPFDLIHRPAARP